MVDTVEMEITNIVAMEVIETAGIKLINTIRVEILKNMLVLNEMRHKVAEGEKMEKRAV